MKSKETCKKARKHRIFTPFLQAFAIFTSALFFSNWSQAKTLQVPVYQGTNKDYEVILGFAEDPISPFQYSSTPATKVTKTNIGFSFDFNDSYRSRLTNISTNFVLDLRRRDEIFRRRADALKTNEAITFPEGLSELHLRRYFSSSAKRLLLQIKPEALIKNSQLADAEDALASGEKLISAAAAPPQSLTGYFKVYFRSMWTGKQHRLEIFLPRRTHAVYPSPREVVYFLADGDFPFEAICRAAYPSNDNIIFVRPGFENSSTSYTHGNAETLFEAQMIVEGSLPVNRTRRSIISPETSQAAFFHYQFAPEKYTSIGLLPAQPPSIKRTNDFSLTNLPPKDTLLFARPSLFPSALSPTSPGLQGSGPLRLRDVSLRTNEPMNLETQKFNFTALLNGISSQPTKAIPQTSSSLTNPRPHDAFRFFHYLSPVSASPSNQILILANNDQIQIFGSNLNAFYIDTTALPKADLSDLSVLLNGKTIFQNMGQEPFQIFVTNRGQTYKIR